MRWALFAALWRGAIAAFWSPNVYAEPSWDIRYRPFRGEYAVYGGDLSDPVAPTRQNKKVALLLEGKAARDLFDAIGPDIKDACSASDGTRMRHKDHENLSCALYVKDGYRCWIGFDLVTGKSIGGVYC